MRFLALLALLGGLGWCAWWYYSDHSHQEQVRALGENAAHSATEARETVRDTLHDLHLNTTDIKEELARTGQIVREKSRELRTRVADATADAKVTTAIKARLVADPSLSALSISVSTTDGVVTLSGRVNSEEEIKKVMDLALATDGCQKAISTLQIKPLKP